MQVNERVGSVHDYMHLANFLWIQFTDPLLEVVIYFVVFRNYNVSRIRNKFDLLVAVFYACCFK